MTQNNNRKRGINPMVAGAVGAAVGAGLAAAGAAAMRDEKTRKKVKTALNKARMQAKKYINEGRQKLEAAKKQR